MAPAFMLASTSASIALGTASISTKAYVSTATAGGLADIVSQLTAINADPNKKYNYTSTFVQLYQGPGANKLQPIVSNAFQINFVNGSFEFGDESIGKKDFDGIRLLNSSISGYLGNKISDKISGGSSIFEIQNYAELVGNYATEYGISPIINNVFSYSPNIIIDNSKSGIVNSPGNLVSSPHFIFYNQLLNTQK